MRHFTIRGDQHFHFPGPSIHPQATSCLELQKSAAACVEEAEAPDWIRAGFNVRFFLFGLLSTVNGETP